MSKLGVTKVDVGRRVWRELTPEMRFAFLGLGLAEVGEDGVARVSGEATVRACQEVVQSMREGAMT